jgi:hypothetical protein
MRLRQFAFLFFAVSMVIASGKLSAFRDPVTCEAYNTTQQGTQAACYDWLDTTTNCNSRCSVYYSWVESSDPCHGYTKGDGGPHDTLCIESGAGVTTCTCKKNPEDEG